jgi:hypothetical protein
MLQALGTMEECHSMAALAKAEAYSNSRILLIARPPQAVSLPWTCGNSAYPAGSSIGEYSHC